MIGSIRTGTRAAFQSGASVKYSGEETYAPVCDVSHAGECLKRFPGNDRFTDKTADMVKLFESNNSLPVDGVAEALMPALLVSARAEVK